MCVECGFSRCPDGCPGKREAPLICPVCGRVCEDLYMTAITGDVVGCDRCIRCRPVEEVLSYG